MTVVAYCENECNMCHQMASLAFRFKKFNFGWGSAQTPLGSLQCSLRPLVGWEGILYPSMPSLSHCRHL